MNKQEVIVRLNAIIGEMLILSEESFNKKIKCGSFEMGFCDYQFKDKPAKIHTHIKMFETEIQEVER